MICRICNQSNFVEIKKPQSNKEKRLDKEQKFIVCKTCDPVFASLSLLSDGYSIAVSIFSPKEDKEELDEKKEPNP